MTVRGSGHLSDTELGSKNWKGDRGSDFSCMTTTTTTTTRATSCQEPETNSIKKNLESNNNVSIHPKQEAIPSNGSVSKLSRAANLRRKEVKLLDGENSTGRGGGFLAKGSLHAAWNRMQETFTDVSWFSSDLFPTHHTGNQSEVRETLMLEVWSVLRICLCAGGGSDRHWKKRFKGCLSWRQKTLFYRNHWQPCHNCERIAWPFWNCRNTFRCLIAGFFFHHLTCKFIGTSWLL